MDSSFKNLLVLAFVGLCTNLNAGEDDFAFTTCTDDACYLEVSDENIGNWAKVLDHENIYGSDPALDALIGTYRLCREKDRYLYTKIEERTVEVGNKERLVFKVTKTSCVPVFE